MSILKGATTTACERDPNPPERDKYNGHFPCHASRVTLF
jgi:hypothetical protein